MSRARTVLLVEDVEDNRGLIRQLAQHMGLGLLEAGDGEEGVRLAAERQPDLILMDLSLPVLDGWAATARLKADPATRAIPVVALTAGATTFEMADTTGQAHIVVEVQSLFDGDVETRDEDVPFAVALSVTVRPDGSLAIQLH